MTPQPEIVRRFNVTDHVLRDACRYAASQYIVHEARFAGFDAEVFEEDFRAELEDVISILETIPTDDVLVDEQMEETEDVQEKVTECLALVRSLKWTIKKTAKKKKSSSYMGQFGYNDLSKARKSVTKMLTFMDDFVNKVASEEEKLKENGMSETTFLQLRTVVSEFKQERREQKESMDRRSAMAEKRIRIQNSIWDMLVLIDEAADYIFENEPSLREIFALPRQVSSGSSDEPDLVEDILE